MLPEIEEIFQENIELMGNIDRAVLYIRMQNYYRASAMASRITVILSKLVEKLLNTGNYFIENNYEIAPDYILDILKGLLEAQENKDYILLADLYELQLYPCFAEIQNVIMQAEEIQLEEKVWNQNLELIEAQDKNLAKEIKKEFNLESILSKGYSIEYSASGLKTAAYQKEGKKKYLHSNGSIVKESFLLANSWLQQDYIHYVIYGLGFGYPIKELLKLNPAITVEIIESNIDILRLACAFTDLTDLLKEGKVKILYDPDFKKMTSLIQKMDKEEQYFIHYPSLSLIENLYYKNQLEDYFINISSIHNQLYWLNGNFKRNTKNKIISVDVLKEEFKGKDLYIVAAGPSLDKNFLKLKDIGENAVLLAVGTVFKKLIYAGIRPDYIIITDAFRGVYRQIEGLESENIPLLYLSTAYYQIIQNYKAEKYLICQEGYDNAEQYAKEKNFNLYQTGGSVVTTALDIGIEFQCKRIIFVGLDLALKDGIDHAKETAIRREYQEDDLRMVEDINGNQIFTKQNLDIYRKWIEKRIEGIKNIEFIDATEGGAKIKGLKIKRLIDIIKKEG